MAFKFVSFAAILAVARAGVPLGYAAAPAVSYSSISSPVGHTYQVGPAVQTYAAPVAHAYAAPVAHTYAAPLTHTYASAPVAYAAAPAIAKYTAPVAYAKTIVAEPEAPAHYDFGYSVSDPHTGDSKSQQESRRGDAVQGSYSLIESDGTKRIVEYTADDHNGFNAVVHKEPAAVAVKTALPVVAKYAAAPVAYASPVAHYAAAPVAQYAASPVAHYAASPVAHYSAAPALYHH